MTTDGRLTFIKFLKVKINLLKIYDFKTKVKEKLQSNPRWII